MFKNFKRVIIYVYLLFFLMCVPIVIFRSFFSDELLYYLQAAKLIREGFLPYRDFFFPQMPFSAFAYILTSTGGFEGLFISRIFAVILFFILSIIFYKKTNSLRILLFFLFNGVFLIFYTIADKDILISFFLSLVFLVSLEEKNKKNLFIAGILIGILTGIRYIFFLSFLFFIPLNKKQLILFISGFIIPFTLIIYFISISPFYFFFDNFYYHLFLRREIQPQIAQKIMELIKTVFYPPNAMILFAFFKTLSRDFKKYYIFIALINFLYYVVLSGTQFFYISHTLPLILFFTRDFFEKMKKKTFILMFAFYFLSGIFIDILFYLPGIKEPQKSFNYKDFSRICDLIDKNIQKNDTIISEVPHITYFLRLPSPLNFRLVASIHSLPFDEHIYSPYHFYLYIKKYNPQILIIHKDNLKYTGIKDNYELLTKFSYYLIYKKRKVN